MDEFVELIQSSEEDKKDSTKESGCKQENGGTVSGSATSRKSKKTSNKSLRRVLSNEADSEESFTDEAATQHPLDEEYKARKNSPFRRDGGVLEEPGTISAAASGDKDGEKETLPISHYFSFTFPFTSCKSSFLPLLLFYHMDFLNSSKIDSTQRAAEKPKSV